MDERIGCEWSQIVERRSFLKCAGLSVFGCLAAGAVRGKSRSATSGRGDWPPDDRGLPVRDAAYYRPLFEQGKGLAG